MNKLFSALAVVCMMSLLTLSVFAATPHTTDQWVTGAVCNVDKGTVTFTYETCYPEGLVEMAIFTAPLDTSGMDMTDEDGPYKNKLARRADDLFFEGRTVGPVGSGADSEYDFVTNTTYYVYLCANENIDIFSPWMWSVTPFEFIYTKEDNSQATADVSVTAYAVATLTGCAALIMVKKK